MDQPQQADEQVHNDGVEDVSKIVEQTATEQPSGEAPVSVPITIIDSTDDTAAGISDPLSTPLEESNSDVPSEPSEPINVTMPADEDLASVANELQAMAAQISDTPQVDEGLPGQDTSNQEISVSQHVGTDPMEQIEANEAMEAENNPNHFPSGETVNEMILSEEPSVTQEASTQESPYSANDSDGEVHVEPTPVTPEPTSQEANTETSAEPVQEPSRSSGGLINDVIAPTAVASALAEGTSGENAITGTPETSSVESAQNAPAAIIKPPKKKSGKGLLVLVVIVVVLLIGGGAVGAYMMQTKKDSPKATTQDSKTQKPADTVVTPAVTTPTSAPGETIAAKTLDDYKAACGGGSVTNATDYKGASPHPVVFFEKGSDEKYAMSIVAFKDKTWAADATKVESGQLAVCVSEKPTTEKKLKTCSITDATTKVTTSVDYYSASYAVDVYNAKTGSKVNSYESPSIVTECPTTATYDKTNPKIVAKYDLASVETLIKPDVTKVF